MNFRRDRFVRRRSSSAVLDITPLIDVVFLLLIFFLLTATFVTNPSIPVNLPTASADLSKRVHRDLQVTVRSTGEIEFQGKVVEDPSELLLRFEKAVKENHSAKLLIRADSRAVVGKMVEVMNVAQKAGLHRFGLATRIKE
ncbi:MAG: biopolymer transporter ExbD [Deltaproteobacteria bacterium]|nr:biopolymer transporter ExbD [Deltaproteobacteria bacterium]